MNAAMTSVLASTVDRHVRNLPRILRAMPWVAGLWALTFLALAAMGLLGRAPHPWAPTLVSPLGALSAAPVSWLIAGLAVVTLAATLTGVTSRQPTRSRVAGWVLVVVGVLVAVAVSDVRALTLLGYLPQIVLALFGVGPGAGKLDGLAFADDLAALAHALGGMAIAATGVLILGRARRLAGLDGLGWRRWARWNRPAVVAAVVVPLCYAVTRIAWAVGVPLGIRPEMLDELGAARYAGLGLALFACVGAWLTTGLVSRWGEVFFSWLPWLGGRRVPLALALVPGLLVSAMVLSAGFSFWALAAAGGLSVLPGAIEDWAAWVPEMLWPIWGGALAVACLGYLGRRTA
jgi:hypothetical protein